MAGRVDMQAEPRRGGWVVCVCVCALCARARVMYRVHVCAYLCNLDMLRQWGGMERRTYMAASIHQEPRGIQPGSGVLGIWDWTYNRVPVYLYAVLPQQSATSAAQHNTSRASIGVPPAQPWRLPCESPAGLGDPVAQCGRGDCRARSPARQGRREGRG